MATFLVKNLNPDFEIPSKSGFWFRTNNDGGLDTNTVDDGTDDVQIAPQGASNNGERGLWVWIDQAFEVDTADAVLLENALNDETFIWLPKNPAYNTVAPVLKDGVTTNPDFDNTMNPLLADGVTLASVTSSVCKHFTVTVS